jgi:hypothetical protein
MSETILRPSRKFLGGVVGFESPLQRNFQKAHLKAYLLGRTSFKWGWITDEETGVTTRGYHLVQQDVNPVTMESPHKRRVEKLVKKQSKNG